MKYIIIAFILIYLLLFLLRRKYSNPYKMIHIFGKKGAGKSTYMVQQMIKHAKRGWIIYTDMESINIPHVRVIDVKDLKDKIPPPHSAIFLEEVGLTFDNRKFKEFDEGYNRFIKYLRKYKCKLYMNSQATDIDLKLRLVMDSMVLCTSVLDCISVIRPINRSITLTEPSSDSESRIADRLSFAKIWNWKFVWMPRYHKYFDSFDADKREEIPYREVGITPPAISGDIIDTPEIETPVSRPAEVSELLPADDIPPTFPTANTDSTQSNPPD